MSCPIAWDMVEAAYSPTMPVGILWTGGIFCVKKVIKS